MGGCKHTGVFVSIPLCMDVGTVDVHGSMCRKGILPLRVMRIHSHRGRNRGREQKRTRERKKIISCYVIPAKRDKPPPRLIWLSIQCGQGLVCAPMIGAGWLSWPHNSPVTVESQWSHTAQGGQACLYLATDINKGSSAFFWEAGQSKFSPLKEGY